MTYLIIRLATLGNVAMTVPVIASLSKRYPNDRFIIASKKKLGAMFASMPNVVFWEVDNHLDWRGMWRLWRVLRHEADAVIDLQDVLRTRVFDLFMKNRRAAVAVGIAVTFCLRFLCHLVTGAWIWGVWMPDEFMKLPMTSPWLYSFLYNGWDMLGELVLTEIVAMLIYKPLEAFFQGKDIHPA